LEPQKDRISSSSIRGGQSILPMHDKEFGKGLVETIKKQLGLKEQE
jgi:hypothetical protein